MNRKRRKSKNKWINLNGNRTDYGSNKDFLLTASRTLLMKRPIVWGHKERRFVKDQVYYLIKRHVQKHKIRGPYLGLAAAHTPEIFSLLCNQIRERFVNCQLRRKDFRKLLEYQPTIKRAFPKKRFGVDFQLHHGDILDLMWDSYREFSIMDLDFMWILDKERAYDIAEAISQTATDDATVAIWHSANRRQKNGDRWTNKVYRPILHTLLKGHFKILKYDQVNYYEGYPMRVDIFTMRRRAA